MPVKKYLHLFDAQIPHHIPAVTGGILKYAKDEQFDGVQFGGDWLDMEGLQGWEHKKPGDCDWGEIHREIKTANLILDLYQKALPNCRDWRWWDGNHELRLQYWLEKFGPTQRYPLGCQWYQDFKQIIPNLHRDLKLKERGFKTYSQQQLGAYGRLHTFHGDDYSDRNEQKNCNLYGLSIMYGHVHRPGRYTKTSPVNSDPISAWSMPCLCNRNPRWKRGSANAWSAGFGVSCVRDEGFFNLYVVDIIRGQFVAPNGKLYGTKEPAVSRVY